MSHSAFSLFDVLRRSLESSTLLAGGSNTDCLLMESAFCIKKVLMSEYESALRSPALVERANGQSPGEEREGNGERGALVVRWVSAPCYGDGVNADSPVHRVTMHVMKLRAHSPLLSISFKHFPCPRTFVPLFLSSSLL